MVFSLSLSQKARFFNLLGKSLEAGLPVSRSLPLAGEGFSRSQQHTLDQSATQLNEGESLANVLQATGWFDAWTVSLIETAEYSGAIGLVCQKLSLAAEAQQRHDRLARSALISGLAGVMGASLLLAVGLRLNREAGLILILGTIAAIAGLVLAPPAYPLRRQVPLLKTLIKIRAMLQLAQLALPLTCGVSLLVALELLNRHTPDRTLRQILQTAAHQVQQGRSLSHSLQGKVPPLVIQYVQTGELTGNLDQMLEKVQEHYEAELEHLLRRTQAVLRPVGLLGVGAIVLILGIQLLQQLQQALPG